MARAARKTTQESWYAPPDAWDSDLTDRMAEELLRDLALARLGTTVTPIEADHVVRVIQSLQNEVYQARKERDEAREADEAATEVMREAKAERDVVTSQLSTMETERDMWRARATEALARDVARPDIGARLADLRRDLEAIGAGLEALRASLKA